MKERRMNLRSPKLRLAGVAATAALALAAAGCGGSSSNTPTGGAKLKGGTASVAFITGTQPNWIFPFMSLTYFSVYNGQTFQQMMYRPLYTFGGNSTSPAVNYPLSLASAPVFSNGGKTITINMKGWKWSNGETVNAKDVVFWLNMMNAEFSNWAAASPGGIPQNMSSYQATGPNQVTINLKSNYSSYWYLYNELSQVTPMPMAWDISKAGGAPGSGGCTTDSAADKWAKCVAVYNFLNTQAKDTGSYDSPSSIWSVVNGPWKLQTFNTNGNDTFVPNTKYSGSPKPTLASVKYVPYTTDTAEYSALQTGNSLNLGAIPSQDLPVKPVSQPLPSNNPLASAGYTLQPNYGFAVDYYQINFNNPTYGPIFKQLYFRQALEYLDDQSGMATSIYRGYGYPTTGAAPTKPPNQWISPAEQGTGPYPFNVSKAKALLTSHGWTMKNGVMTCSSAAKCGAGVKAGTPLTFDFDYSSGSTVFTQEAQIYKSDMAKAGIKLNINAQSFNTIIGEATPCKPGPKCSWTMLMYGGWIYAPDYEPTGEELFFTGAGSNSGSYSDPKMDQLITATTKSGDLSTFHQFADYTAQQLPFIWMPNSYGVDAVSNNLHNVHFNPLGTFTPEYWYFTKKS